MSAKLRTLLRSASRGRDAASRTRAVDACSSGPNRSCDSLAAGSLRLCHGRESPGSGDLPAVLRGDERVGLGGQEGLESGDAVVDVVGVGVVVDSCFHRLGHLR